MNLRIRSSWTVSWLEARKAVRATRMQVIIVLFIIATNIFLTPIVRLAHSMETPLNVIEPFVALGNNLYYVMFYMSGLILVIHNAPFYEKGETNLLLRIHRSEWIVGKIVYLLLVTIVYFLLIAITSVITIAPESYITNVWSDLGKLTSISSISTDQKLGIYLTARVISQFSPWSAAFITFTLMCLYGFFSCLLLMLINLNLHKDYGFIGPVLTALWAFAINRIDKRLYYLSPMHHSILDAHDFGYDAITMPKLYVSYFLLLILITTILILILYYIRTYSFPTSKHK